MHVARNCLKFKIEVEESRTYIFDQQGVKHHISEAAVL